MLGKSVAIYTTEKPESSLTIQTSYNNTAAIRAADTEGLTVNKNGLRTYNLVLRNYIETEEIVEYGSIVVRQEYLSEKFGKTTDPEFEDVRLDNASKTLKDFIGKGIGLGIAYREEGADTFTSNLYGFEGAIDLHWASGPSDRVFTSYITGIAAKNYGDEYLVRTYAVDKYGNIYYGNTSSISVFKVAKAIDDAYNGEGSLGETEAKDIAAFKTFVGADTQNYVKWCGDAGVGKLYAKTVLGVDVENELGEEEQ